MNIMDIMPKKYEQMKKQIKEKQKIETMTNCVMCGASIPGESGNQCCKECVERVAKSEIKEFVKIANEVANDKKALFDELFFEIPSCKAMGDSMLIVLYPYARIGTVVGDLPRAIALNLNHSKDSFRKLIETISDELYKGIKEYHQKGE